MLRLALSVPIGSLVLCHAADATAATTETGALPRSGMWHVGVGVELLGLGPVEVFGAHGAAFGLGATTALHIDLGTHLTLRVPLEADSAVRHSEGAYADLTFSPGLLYRFRSEPEQRWIPYVGAGLRLAGQGVRRDFVGEPLVTTNALRAALSSGLGPGHLHTADLFEEHHHADDPNFETELGVAPELWFGVDYQALPWLALNLGATYVWVRTHGENLHMFRETFAVRFTF